MLTQQEKQSLVDAMMTQASQIEEPHFLIEMAECAWHDLKLMEPILNDLLHQAEQRGRFAFMLEIMAGAVCAPSPAKVKCYACEEPAQFITYKMAHCFAHRPEVQ